MQGVSDPPPPAAARPDGNPVIGPHTQAALTRLAASLDRLVPHWRAATRFGVAVSGGPDSVALLLAMAHLAPGRVAAATVDHGLRPQSRAEADAVAQLCAQLDIPHSILSPAAPISGSVQVAARDVRYRLLLAWADRAGCDILLTAHHADDQAETVMMRLLRGAGLSGLSGVRARRGKIVRPMLDWRKADVLAVIQEWGVAVAHDPGNTDPRFDRARMRQHLANNAWIDPRALAQSAHHLAAAEKGYSHLIDRLLAETATHADGKWTLRGAASHPDDVQRRLCAQILARMEGDRGLDGPAMGRFLASLQAGRPAMLGNVLARPARDGDWSFQPAPARRTLDQLGPA